MSDFPKITHVGKKSGEWPIYAFSDERSAAGWAAANDGDGRRRSVWAIKRLELGPEMRGESIPASAVLKPIREGVES